MMTYISEYIESSFITNLLLLLLFIICRAHSLQARFAAEALL